MVRSKQLSERGKRDQKRNREKRKGKIKKNSSHRKNKRRRDNATPATTLTTKNKHLQNHTRKIHTTQQDGDLHTGHTHIHGQERRLQK